MARRLRTAWLLDVGTKPKQVPGLTVRMVGKRLLVVRHGAVVRLEVGEGGAGEAELSSWLAGINWTAGSPGPRCSAWKAWPPPPWPRRSARAGGAGR